MSSEETDEIRNFREYIRLLLDEIGEEMYKDLVTKRKKTIEDAANEGTLYGGSILGKLIELEKENMENFLNRFLIRIDREIIENPWMTNEDHLQTIELVGINALRNKFLESNKYIRECAKDKDLTYPIPELSAFADNCIIKLKRKIKQTSLMQSLRAGKQRELREFEFVNYLFQLLNRNDNFQNVKIEAEQGKDIHFRADLIAEEKINGQWQKYVVECKVQSSFTASRLNNIIAELESYQKFVSQGKLIFAFPGELSAKANLTLKDRNIEVWDLTFLANTFYKEIQKVPHPILQPMLLSKMPSIEESPEDGLIKELKECIPGKKDWVKYQKLVGSILERLFCPPLSTPISELPDFRKINRRDFILPNYSEEGFWAFIRTRYFADFITIDAKNLSSKIKKNHVLQIANYLKQHGLGLFGIIICRNGGDRSCIQTIREEWAIDKKLIIVLTDDDIEQMLLAKSSRGTPETIIRQKIEEFRLVL